MSPEEKSLLERTYKLAEENNEILRSIRSGRRWGIAFKVFYWAIIIGLSYGAYYFIQPYLKMVTGVYGQVQDNIDNVQSVTSKLTDLLK